jgi:hypothetical protein
MKTIDAENEILLEATRIAREKMAACLGELMELALKLCKGIERKKFYPKGHPKEGQEYTEIEHDTAMLRFLLERFNVDSLEELCRAIEQVRSSERTFQ